MSTLLPFSLQAVKHFLFMALVGYFSVLAAQGIGQRSEYEWHDQRGSRDMGEEYAKRDVSCYFLPGEGDVSNRLVIR